MTSKDKNEGRKPDPAAAMDAAVKKAEDAEKRLRLAEDGPLESMAAGGAVADDTDAPGRAAGGPG